MRKRIGLFAAGLFFSVFAFAQDEKIETDRPGESNSVQTVKKGYLQVEAGFRKEQVNSDNHFYLHPRANLKWGLSKRIELRAEATASTEKNELTNESQSGLQPVELGFKAKLWEGKGAVPTASFYTQVGFPKWASKAFQTNYVFPKVRMLFQNELNKKLKLVYNIGAEWQGEIKEPEWLFTLQPQVSLTAQWETFAEYYVRTHSDTHPEHVLDGGLAFYPNNNVKLDASGGVGLSQGASNYFVALGVSFRLK